MHRRLRILSAAERIARQLVAGHGSVTLAVIQLDQTADLEEVLNIVG